MTNLEIYIKQLKKEYSDIEQIIFDVTEKEHIQDTFILLTFSNKTIMNSYKELKNSFFEFCFLLAQTLGYKGIIIGHIDVSLDFFYHEDKFSPFLISSGTIINLNPNYWTTTSLTVTNNNDNYFTYTYGTT